MPEGPNITSAKHDQSEEERLDNLRKEILKKRPFVVSVVYQTLIKKGNRKDMTESLVNEILAKAIIKITQYRGEGSLEAWLAKIATNAVYVFFRKIKNEPRDSRKIPIDNFEGKDEIADIRLNPEELFLKQEQETTLEKLRKEMGEAIEKLKNNEKQALKLRNEGVDYEEIANIMGITKSAVATIIYRARRNVATHMKKYEHFTMDKRNSKNKK